MQSLSRRAGSVKSYLFALSTRDTTELFAVVCSEAEDAGPPATPGSRRSLISDGDMKGEGKDSSRGGSGVLRLVGYGISAAMLLN